MKLHYITKTEMEQLLAKAPDSSPEFYIYDRGYEAGIKFALKKKEKSDAQ